MTEPIIEFQNVTIAFGNDVILENVNMTILPHETIVLVGLSGSGKSVLLKALAGLYRPVEGVAKCHGRDWKDLSMTARHEIASHIGMQFQKGALFDDLDAYDNVAYPLREHTRMSEDQIHQRVLECLRAVDLEKAEHLKPYEMSGGMNQRLGIARAIALKPEILFMDDPTAGLDPIHSDDMAEMILKLKEEIGATLIVVTHDRARAFQFAGRIFLVANGTVIETGSAQETQNHPDPRVQQFLHGWLTGPLTETSEPTRKVKDL